MNALRKALALMALLAAAPGCTTDAYCFDKCDGSNNGGKPPIVFEDSGPGITLGDSGTCFGANCPSIEIDSGHPKPPCEQTNAGVEICDGKDNDCDGLIDEPGTAPDGIDFSRPRTCGTCDTDCTAVQHVDTPTCTPPAEADLGKVPGKCGFTACAPNTYDVDGDPTNGCEYGCPWNPDGKNTKDVGGAFGCGKDDDCNGKIDDGIDLCKDPDNCGLCGRTCTLPNTVSSKCVTTADSSKGQACDVNNTQCLVEKCADGFYDADGAPENGCEYPCAPTNGGVEICDGLDNDCDHKVDNEDPDLEATVGSECQGGDKGICAANKGFTKCIDGALTCCDKSSNNAVQSNKRYPETGLRNDLCDGDTAPHVYVPGELQEICDNVDNDCDGAVDGATVDANAVCGSSVGTCTLGHTACIAGKLECPDATGKDPNGELCDGKDNDCDGVIDGTAPATKQACTTNADCTTAPYRLCVPLSNNPNDKGCVAPPKDIADPATGSPLACDVTPAPPAGIPQPCRPGLAACFGGQPVCVGSIKRPLDLDRCGEDTNCNGVLDNQSGLSNADPKNCGACGHDCTAGAPNATWECRAGQCVATGCAPGHIECGGTPGDCETACTFDQSDELCDGRDNDCDCKVDEAPIVAPSPIQACGVSASATDPGCAAKVAIACTAGAWKCTFTDPAYCTNGNCTTTPDLCDGKDNNCDGVIDEGFRPPLKATGFLGQTCFSDDGKPAPGDGPCRTQGTFVCTADGTNTMCSASKDPSKATGEKCDGLDNDCNGIIDDPAVVATTDSRIGQTCFGGTLGICAAPSASGKNACVAGAILCTGANIVRPGEHLETCNGKDDDCDGTVDNHLTDTGGTCGSGVGECKTGTQRCINGALACNDVGPTPEVCDGLDNNCNGQIDDSPTDVGTACNVPPAPPAGVPQPCKAGVYACIGSTKVCNGSITSPASTDACGEDTNCDGKLTNQSNLNNNDVHNCGACGNDCAAKDPTGNSIWACQAGVCVHTGCVTGFIDCDGNANTCERACTITSSTETCNGKDDNCDCQIDNNVTAATAVQVCGVSPSATDVGCTITPTCQNGAWSCAFPTGYCTGGNCSTTAERCDGKDNDCDGLVDENFKAPILATGFLGQSCSTPASDGPCQGTGSYVCNATGLGTQCTATKDTTKSKAETCNGIDDDCNGTIDDAAAVSSNDPRVGKQCFGGTKGECAAASHAGTMACQSGAVVCTGANLLTPNSQPELCNTKDDDCDGTVDNNPTDVGQTCGSGQGACTPGKFACVSGAKVCQGGTSGGAETCNGIDDDCDGTIDNHLTDTGGDCNVPPAAPAPTAQCPVVTEPCKKGTLQCSGGILSCQGSVTASSSTPDGCCADTNCDGILTNQPDFLTDVHNCGGCGNDCDALGAGKHGVWACQAGACVRTGCAAGFINCDGTSSDCERACTFSGAELCNGVDDDCNCTADDNVASVPSPTQVCDVSASASDPKCLPGDGVTGVKVTCNAGAWKCQFPAGYCDGGSPKAGCLTTTDICDGGDNNCNGNSDENQKLPILTTGYLGQACASDDGKPPPGDGQCRTTGSFVCNGNSATKCSATRNNALAGQEFCDGVDNDCDGSVDEVYTAKGTNPTFYVKPAVVSIGTNLWMYTYEASRPNSGLNTPGTGNGYWTTAPAGTTVDKTSACSSPSKIPWFNVTPTEVEQTCSAMGGFICSTANFTTGCQAGSVAPNLCKWSYNGACTTTANYTSGPFCNLGPFDFDLNPSLPNSDGLLPTAWSNPPNASGVLKNCVTSTGLFDITGNLREITKRAANDYPLMGGAFNSQSEDGAACTFDFYSATSTFKFYDTGFRCCFSSNPD